MPSPSANEERVDGRYRLRKLLGRGGMGSVHLALDESTGRQVALKRLLSREASDLLVALFEREYRALASLRHPRIVRVFEYGVDPAGPYYTMELLEGSDLSESAPMPWREVCSCLRDAASILGVLHARRLIHRDLNPRNLWRTPDGRLKLLDFGALATFGKADEIVGTPPLIAPESLQRAPLDGRTDLYSLGALGYWLLTGNHAFPARSMGELPGLWHREPAHPSSLVRLIKGVDHDLPPALDELLLALMQLEPDERPQATVYVIDTLNDAAGLPPEAEDVVVSGYLENAAFVGRKKPRARFERALHRATRGTPSSLFLSAPAGMGRSRLLAELALTARLAGASVVELQVSEGANPYALAAELCRRLLGVLPQAGREAARPFAAELRALSTDLAALIEPPSQPHDASPADRNQERMERQRALAGFVRALAVDRTLVVTVDDVHLADQESLALLAELAHSTARHKLVLVSSVVEERVEVGLSTLGKLRERSKRWSLAALSVEETHELMGSLFGQVPLLQRFSARLHELAGGRPDHLLTLARHLVNEGVVHYAEGSWVIPLDLPADLPTSADAGAVAQLQHVSEGARLLAQRLSVPDHAPLTQDIVRALWDGEEAALEAALAQLSTLGLLRRAREGVYLPHEAVREHLWAALDGAAQRQVHRTIGGLLELEGDAPRLTRASLHLVRAGDVHAAQRPLIEAVRTVLANADAGALRVMAPALAEIEARLREEGVADHLRAAGLAGLGMAGYLVDGAYAVTYGDEARQLFERVLCMRLARPLRSILGGRLALLLALLSASVLLGVRRSRLKTLEVVHWFVMLMSSVIGTMASYIDNAAVRRYAHALEPFGALGEDHIATFARDFGLALAHGGEEAPHLSLTAMQAALDRLQSPKPIEGLDDLVRGYMIGGCLLSNGIRMNLAARREALDMADELARIGPLQDMQADYLRGYYYATQGDIERARHFRQSLENKAVQLGNCWQAEVTGPSSEMLLHTYTFDVVALKRATREVQALAARVPSLAPYVVTGRMGYAQKRGRHERALEIAASIDEPPGVLAGWTHHRGVVAAAHNGLGDHARAREVCLEALDYLQPEDLDFVLMNLNTRVELSLAEAALGEYEASRAHLESLLATYDDRGPLIRGYLLQALVRMTRDAGDLDASESYLTRMRECHEPLLIPSLRSLCARYTTELRELRNPGQQHGLLPDLQPTDSHLQTRVNLMLSQSGTLTSERAAMGVQLAVNLTGARGGWVIQLGAPGPMASMGEDADPHAIEWARQRLQGTADDDVTVVETTAEPSDGREDLMELEDTTYLITLLWHPGQSAPLAALLLRFDRGQQKMLPEELRQALAHRLWEGLSEASFHSEEDSHARGA